MGGREFGKESSHGIARQDVAPTIEYLARLAKIPKEDLIVLGSAGKKARSGDIDVALDSKSYTALEFEAVVEKLKGALGEKHWLYRPGFKTNAFSVPIGGDPKKGRVQIDLKYNDGEFLKFSHFSAEGERSQYKGAVRTLLLASLATRLHQPGKDVQLFEDGKLIVDVRWGLDANEGLKRVFRMRKLRSDGAGRKKSLENVSPAEIRAEFPELEFDGRARVVRSPQAIVTRLFGKGVKPEQVETAEGVIELIRERHPKLVEKGFFESVAKKLGSMGLTVPEEFSGARPDSAPHGGELCLAALPNLKTEWREFVKAAKSGKQKVWSVSIDPAGESFRIREGESGKPLRESQPICPGERGNPGTPAYLSAGESCLREVERRIQLRLRSGFAELVEGQLIAPELSGIDFSKPFPKNIRTPKPEQYLEEDEFKRLHQAGLTRITRKYDGMGLTLVNHTYGWEAYSLQGNRVTDYFPKQLEALGKTDFGVGTVLKAEGVVFSPTDPAREDFALMNKAFSPARKWQDVRASVDRGEVLEPQFVIYDILFENGNALSRETYDKRAKRWQGLPVANGENGLLLSAERYPDLTPDNWRSERKKLGFEGFVLADGSSTLGERAISFGTNPPRPKGIYKLKPNMEEDVVIYAVRKVDEKFESVFVKQRYPDRYPGTSNRHPQAGEWFACGRVSINGMKDVVGEIERLVKARKIRVVGDNREGESLPIDNSKGVVAVIEFFDRYASNKFRHPKFARPVRIRDGGPDCKDPEECTAHYLGGL